MYNQVKLKLMLKIKTYVCARVIWHNKSLNKLPKTMTPKIEISLSTYYTSPGWTRVLLLGIDQFRLQPVLQANINFLLCVKVISKLLRNLCVYISKHFLLPTIHFQHFGFVVMNHLWVCRLYQRSGLLKNNFLVFILYTFTRNITIVWEIVYSFGERKPGFSILNSNKVFLIFILYWRNRE
jgi:hypothetical protein